MTERAVPGKRRLLAGRYRVEGVLGSGGMSEVSYGYDERLDRPVAIKTLRPYQGIIPAAPDSPEAAGILDAIDRDQRRFLREIRTTARLEHPGIPAVYDTGTESRPGGGRQLWVVMQLLRGSPVRTILDRAGYEADPPGVAWAAAVVAQVAAVLTDVHHLDIVHRDIKPENVMITDGGLVKVLDFGIAILRGAGALPRLTQTGRTVGTPPYMSPEQCLGQSVTTASDIYSLGCLAFELLTGDPPFQSGSADQLRIHHLSSAPPSARGRRPGVPASFDALVTSMLAKNPLDRPAARRVYDTLAAMTSVPGVPAGADVRRDPTRPFRRPLLGLNPARAARTAGKPLTDAEFLELEARARRLLDGNRPAEAIQLLDDGVARAADDAMSLQLRHHLAAALFYADEYTRAAALLDDVGREYSTFRSPADRDVLDCSYHAGYAYAQIGRPAKALAHLRFYIQNANASGHDEASKILESRYLIAQMLHAQGRTDDALDELKAIRPALAASYGTESTQLRNLDKMIRRIESSSGASPAH